MVLLTFGADGYVQFITVLILFVLVLGITAFTTRWIAGYQKQQGVNNNIEVLESARIANNKWIQIVRIGEKIMAIAVCKDSVTMLGEIPREQLKEREPYRKINIKEMLEKAVKKDAEALEMPKDKQGNEDL